MIKHCVTLCSFASCVLKDDWRTESQLRSVLSTFVPYHCILFDADLCCSSGDQNWQSFWVRLDSLKSILLVPWLAEGRWLEVRLRRVFDSSCSVSMALQMHFLNCEYRNIMWMLSYNLSCTAGLTTGYCLNQERFW